MTVSSSAGMDRQPCSAFRYEDGKFLVKFFFGAFDRNNLERARIAFVSSVVAVKPFFEVTQCLLTRFFSLPGNIRLRYCLQLLCGNTIKPFILFSPSR